MSKGVKRKCTFNSELQADYPFLKKVYGKNDRVKCTNCSSEFSISHGGRSDIKDHTKSAKHKANLQVAAKNVRLDSFFKKTLLDDGDLLLAAKEATFACHCSAVHNISFKTADCSSKLIAKLCEPKFRSARTKTEAIILNAIVSLAAEELKNDLMEINFVTLTADASNRKDVKLIPVMARYFWPEEGVKSKLLDFHSVLGETAVITNCLVSTLRKNNLTQKIVAYCGDNCNTNFGGVNRKGKNNVFSYLKKELGRNIVGVGCGAHIVHNCIQTQLMFFLLKWKAWWLKFTNIFTYTLCVLSS